MSVRLSIFIICKNEAHIIGQTLAQAAKIADEIIVVDSGSSDETLEIAKKYTDEVHHQDWLGYGAQKNFALDLCHGEWCLNIDADEVLTDELIREIRDVITNPGQAVAFKIPRKLFIADKFIRHGGYYPDAQLRLFKNGFARFNQRAVHESLELDLSKLASLGLTKSSIKTLDSAMEHYAYRSFQEMQDHFLRYAALGKEYVSRPSLFLAWLKAVYSFLNKFFLRLGFLHGALGLRLALLHARYSFLKYSP